MWPSPYTVLVILIRPFGFITPKTLNHLALQSFDFVLTWWKLFQKRAVRVYTELDIYVFIKLTALLGFHSARSPKQQSAGTIYNTMSLHSDTLYWFRANQSLFFLLNQPKLVKWNQLKNTCPTPFHSRDIKVLDEKLVIILIIKVAICAKFKFQIWCDSPGKYCFYEILSSRYSKNTVSFCRFF